MVIPLVRVGCRGVDALRASPASNAPIAIAKAVARSYAALKLQQLAQDSSARKPWRPENSKENAVFAQASMTAVST
jgi:hypothetical protein